jgi:hypothetical protein
MNDVQMADGDGKIKGGTIPILTIHSQTLKRRRVTRKNKP